MTHVKARRNTFSSVDEMISFYSDRENNLHTAFPALRGQLGSPIYLGRGRISPILGQYANQICFIIKEWRPRGIRYY